MLKAKTVEELTKIVQRELKLEFFHRDGLIGGRTYLVKNVDSSGNGVDVGYYWEDIHGFKAATIKPRYEEEKFSSPAKAREWLLKANIELSLIVGQLFKISPDHAQSLVKDIERRSSYGFSSQSLAREVIDGKKYLEIKPDGLTWQLANENYDEVEVVEQSSINFELWLFDQRLKQRIG